MSSPHPPLFTSLEAMIALENILALLGLPEGPWRVGREAVSGGLSGARLERITLTNGDRYAAVVLKQIDPRTNWLMRAAGDTTGREIAFTQSPLWERLPADIDVPVLAAARFDDGAGALLLPDLAPVIYPSALCYEPADEGLVQRILDHLAALHAAFWGDPTLHAQPWLATPADALFALSLDRLSDAAQTVAGEDTYGDQALRMWPYLWRFIDSADASAIWRTLMHPEALLAAVGSAPATLAHGDTWVANMGGLAPTPQRAATVALAQAQREAPPTERLLLLDWALVTAGPATYDSLWLAQTWHTLDPLQVLAWHRAALLRHHIAAAQDDATWALLADLGWVRTFLMGAEWMVRDVRGAQTDDEDRAARARLNSWCHRAADILRARGW
jgi:hypothetical protein